jgi:hypothetical protein
LCSKEKSSCNAFVTPVFHEGTKARLNFGGMNAEDSQHHFPMSKGAFLLLGMLLLFITSIVAIYLWYDLRLAEIDRMLHQLSQ